MTATSGLRLLDFYRKSGPVGLLVRTLLGTSLWASTTFYLTWKASTTPRKRLLFRLVPSAPHTDETGFSLWPTPKATEIEESVLNWKERKEKEGSKVGGPSLNVAVKMWPTPVTNDAKNATLPPAATDWDNIPGALIRTGHQGQLNPEWVECLMGFPIGWTEV